MSIYEFMSDSPILTFFLVYIVALLIFKLVNRVLRCINIIKHGYPPEHCDADGDFGDFGDFKGDRDRCL